MAHEYHPEAWRELFLMLGSSATALDGLLLVVLTLHTVQRDRDFHLRARNNACHPFNVFVMSSLAVLR